jgi:hypothetical protein
MYNAVLVVLFIPLEISVVLFRLREDCLSSLLRHREMAMFVVEVVVPFIAICIRNSWTSKRCLSGVDNDCSWNFCTGKQFIERCITRT